MTPNGKHAIAGGGHAALPVFDVSALAPAAVDPDALCRWAELVAGQRLHEGGGTVNLSGDEWFQRWSASTRR